MHRLNTYSKSIFTALMGMAFSSCTLQAKISDLASGPSAGTFSLSIVSHSDFGTISSASYTSTKQNITITPTVTGQMTSFSVSPSLPTGLSLNTTTGVISGRPTTPTLSNTYTVTGTDGLGAISTQTLTFEVAGYYLVTTTTDASDASAGDNICATAASQCSVRAATEEAAAQATGTLALIELPSGTFTLSGTGLSLTTRTIMTGAGAANSIVSGGGTVGPILTTSATYVSIDGLAARNGSKTGQADSTGVGIYSTSNSLVLKNCDVSNNSTSGGVPTTGQGIGLYYNNASGDFSMSNCTVSNNSFTGSNASAGVNGGGARITALTATISSSSFTNNTLAPSGGSANASGGGLFVSGGTLVLSNSTISNNTVNATSSRSSGGLRTSSDATITNLTCSSNSVVGGIGHGGCINTTSSIFTISDSTISGNTIQAGSIGSGLYLAPAASATISVQNTTMTGSSQNLMGTTGASNIDGTMTIKNSTFYNTSSGFAVTLQAGSGNIAYSLEHVTIQHNNAAGIALYLNLVDAASSVTVKNSIIDKVGASTACSLAGAGTKTSLGYNVARDATCTFLGGTDVQSSATIGLSALASNGGNTQTMAIGTGSSAYNLVPSGSCSLTTDQRGSTRPNAGACDAGAYEY